ncbi:MAG: sulfite exporter TauE/SafE family protein [Acidimicrobiales bacterium]
MTPLGLLAVAGAGLVAGAVNTIAGAGSLLSFPLLVGLGLSPLAANVTNDVGLTPSNGAGALSLRRELRGQGSLLRIVVPVAAAGSLAGGVLLLVAPPRVFAIAAPVMLLVGSLLTVAQPRLTALAQRGARSHRGWLRVAVGTVAVYGGYFGTGIGVLFVAVLQLFVRDKLRRLNASKIVLALVSNGVAGVLFAFVGPVHWLVALVLAASASIGAPIGGWLSYRISASTLRKVICVVGVAASAYLFWHQS